ncbi:hypothetical protein DAETH_14020 [Deinococcus aetherius]|uniref:Tetratricopeptide repeat protein n=1 Tax=Deinococcus aetherius TaxID=200252 RepID=A0ABN6RFG7_9DEIO|nr:hypothetical protein [Deinococcus aetherius]BDP41433.1 hypothetical protein DAETH_14020 [Deinococcus aetherius]
MLEQVWATINEGRNGEARALLETDPALLASDDGQHTLGYILAHEGLLGEARAVYARLRHAYAGQPKEHIFVHQQGMVERLAGDHQRALQLFMEERALIDVLPGDRAFERAVNGYEVGVNRLALGEIEAARSALCAALNDARTADDLVTTACVHRALGDFAAQTGDPATARSEYDLAHAAFESAGADRAAHEVQARRAAL